MDGKDDAGMDENKGRIVDDDGVYDNKEGIDDSEEPATKCGSFYRHGGRHGTGAALNMAGIDPKFWKGNFLTYQNDVSISTEHHGKFNGQSQDRTHDVTFNDEL